MLNLSELREAIRYENGVSRRLMLAYASSLASLPLLPRISHGESAPSFSDNPFSLGVASGDPAPNGFVIWSRLAPKPLEPFGGMPATPVEVTWEVADSEAMSIIRAKGKAIATPQLGHSIHVEVEGLDPNRWYWYRFRAGDAESPLGRTRTTPPASSTPKHLKFAVTSCQNFEQGLYTAYEQMADDDVDLVVHLGDYIYEQAAEDNKVRKHHSGEITSLNDYRARYSQYRSDPLLQKMHAQCPWLITWDDHEFDNNCAGDISEEKDVDPVEYLIRRANAYQAFYEMMPLRRRSLPKGPDLLLYRRMSYGRLAEFIVLDERQYRSDQPNDDKASPLNEAALNTSNTMLGERQRNWLYSSLNQSNATWNVLAQQVMMGMVGFPQKEDKPATYSMDQWPGYAAERMRLLQYISERRVPNPIVLTGDIHSNWVNELRVDDRQADADVVAAEFVGTSLSSGGNGSHDPAGYPELLAANPCIKWHNRERGYIVCDMTPQKLRSDYMVVDDVLKPGGKTFKRASFVVEAGSSRIETA